MSISVLAKYLTAFNVAITSRYRKYKYAEIKHETKSMPQCSRFLQAHLTQIRKLGTLCILCSVQQRAGRNSFMRDRDPSDSTRD